MDNWSNGNAAQHPRLFNQATAGSKILTEQSNAITILNHVLASRSAMYLQALVVPLALWIRPIVICLAIFWLSYRAYRVLCIPLDELAILLGFDIPPVPSIDIAGIKADGVIIHWSLPEKQKAKSSSKYELHLDGRIIETLSIQEDAVTISGLRPGTFHVVRVALVTSHEFSSKSAPARFRTKLDSTVDSFHHMPEHHGPEDDFIEPLLRITPYRGLKDFAPIPDEHPVQVLRSRDSMPNLNRRRSTINRRVSPAAIETVEKTNEEVDTESEIIRQLTEKLDEIRREHQEIERSAREEEDEDVKTRDALIKERDQLRAEVAEKEKASRNLRREVDIMTRQNTASQTELSKHRRLLEQKHEERRKFYEDLTRWQQEAAQMRADTTQLYEQKDAYAVQTKAEIIELRQQLSDKLVAIKAAEEEIKETNAEIKKVERTAKNPSPSGNDHVTTWPQQLQLDTDEDRRFHARMAELQQEYSLAARQLDQSKQIYATSIQYLEAARERRRQDEAAIVATSAPQNRDLVSPPTTEGRLPSRRDSQRSRREKESPRTTTFGPSSVFGGPLSSTSFSSAPLFAFSNGLSVATNSDGMSEEDRERLTGGAHVSPAAIENLLPADLFGSDDRNTTENVLPLPGLGALPGLPGSLPGLGQQPMAQDSYNAGPASPASVSSRAASTFASPQASQQNLHHHLSSPDALNDTDGRSIRSNRSGRAASNDKAGSRFSAMFGIRPRNKNALLNDPLGLPLSKTHSHSMPRQDGGLAGLDGMARKRNSSLSGSAFDTALDGDDIPASDASGQPKKRLLGLNPFSKEKTPDSWPSSFSPFGKRPPSPKPESSHSNELPRPSFDSTRLGFDSWPVGESNAARASPLSLGGWNTPIGSTRNFASRHQSRRTSLQHSIASPPEDIIEDDDSDILDPDLEPHLAPIGTKPTSSKKAGKQADTKLNPNAKDFKSFLGIRLREKEKGKTSTDSNAPGKDSVEDDSSPAQSRRSRDGRSITTRDSSISGSRRNSNPDDLVLSPSLTNSEATSNSPQIGAGTSFGKESFMQKITRKSSSSKFALPTFKREKTKLDAQSPALPPTADDDEDAMSASVGSLKEREKDARESVEKNRGAGNARSWSNVLKIGKKRGGETPSVSELSTASEMTGDDAEEV